jgi:hypothetical protein
MLAIITVMNVRDIITAKYIIQKPEKQEIIIVTICDG